MAEIKDCCSCIYETRSTFTEPCVSCGDEFLNYMAKPTPKRKQKTNADYLRSISDDELAKILCAMVSPPNKAVNCGICIAADYCRMGHTGFIDWLKQEAET